MTQRLMVVLGTRPEVIKLAPVITALRSRPETFEIMVCSTDQHREMLDQTLAALEVVPDLRLDVMHAGQTLAELTVRLVSALAPTLARVKPDRLVVQGDTTTAFAAALCGYYERIPVAHVEAGLRSFNHYSPFPEEVNRRAIGAIADLHFAPTRAAADALVAEGVPKSSVYVTGNTVVDALRSVRSRLDGPERAKLLSNEVATLADCSMPLIIASCHRRESVGPDLEAVCRALRRIAHDFPNIRIVFTLHPNPTMRSGILTALGGERNISLVEPLSYPDLLFLLSRARLVLTDSGGIQEEAPSFGVPVLILRRHTERMEAINAGLAFLVGPDEDLIVRRATECLSGALKPLPSDNPFGDGHAAERIVNVLARAA
jgi:UDP-N-acetylglucosamine 2-epimerase (non-hydrolysing)